jgi:putative tricarboxylic transport membrane protein
LTALFALALLAFDLLRKTTPPAGPRAAYGAVALHFAMFAVYAVALPWVGFRIATFAYVAATNALLDVPRSARGWLRVALLALCTVLGTYYVFEHYLSVLLPRGRWIDF